MDCISVYSRESVVSGKRMETSTKFKIGLNAGIDIIVIIFMAFLNEYNKILFEIQSQYTNIFEQSLRIVSEPNYYNYFVLGIVFAGALIAVSAWDFRYKEETVMLLVAIVINISILISLIIVFSNPIVTAFVITSSMALAMMNRI